MLAGLADRAWRVAEMCLKVSALRQLPCGDDAVRLARHELPRVRAAALRALGAAGDVEHVPAVRDALDDDVPEVGAAAARALDRMGARLDLPG
ncbi:MAG: HEAT repeat domain-containing protein [Nocardioides sp.]